MGGQGLLFKVITSTGAKNFLGINRITSVHYQQQAGLKHATVEKLKQLNLPEKPKKPMSVYFRFMLEQKPAVVKSNPHMKQKDIVKLIAADWKNVHGDVKEKYMSEYHREMEDYNKRLLTYNNTLSEEQKDALQGAAKEKKDDQKRRALKKRYKETGKPKRPIGPFMIYLMDLAEKENKKVNELITTVKGKWSELSEEERRRYMLRYDENKKNYDIAMDKWEARMIREGNEDIVRKKVATPAKPSRLLALKQGKED